MDRRLVPIALASIALALTGSASRGAETLRWKFAEGDSHRYRLEQTTINTAVVMEQEVKMSIFQTVEMTWEVESVEDEGAARLVQTIDRMRVALESQFLTFSYDSSDDAPAEGQAAMLEPVVDALVGVPVVLVMTPRGEVREVEVPDELIQRLKDAGPAAQALQNLASPEGMKGLIGQSTLVFPQEPIEEGATWARKVELPTPQGTMTLDNAFTFRGIEGGDDGETATIDVAMTIDSLEAAPDSPFELTVQEQEGRGSYAFDTSAGLLRSSEVTQTLSVVARVMDQELTSVAESTATFSLVED
ncbi:DUF6263 family protein [Tautonia plasticadhaerens]|uniref:Uncharacterized protein n=1 Tax=Tautonia plasticadhaerens TaxID=2527974 RepID=A0A518HCL3_9BACT|nr:DUF6263 family protein [Tautonia plasticadhaerens]QDV38603.1 hypothetical protein ElP_65580 [Tautonia plasticadhaerens]